MENYNIKDSRITSPARRYFLRPPRHARLNGRYSWCALGKTHLQIDLGKDYKVTSIATQGGRMDTGDKWVKQYKVAFYAGATLVMYSESGLAKVRNLKIYCKPNIYSFLYHNHYQCFSLSTFLFTYLLFVPFTSHIRFLIDCDTMQVFLDPLFRFSGI